ncbi:hypothetical protein ACJJTC_011873 [Scirpophaga incertulas]
MFLNTISCGPKMIRTAMSKFANTSSLALVDNRGRHSHHKTSINEEMIKSVLDHVNSFEPVDSHYCRKDSNKVYLDGSLNFVQMYNLYKEWYDAAKYGTKYAVESHVKIVNPPVRTRRQMTDRSEIPLQVAYHQLLPIQPSKKKDLLDLCRKNIIPPLYHGYYESLVTSNDAILMNESDNEN